MGTVANILKIKFFRTLEVIQRLTTVQVVLTQEKWLSISKNSELYGILT